MKVNHNKKTKIIKVSEGCRTQCIACGHRFHITLKHIPANNWMCPRCEKWYLIDSKNKS